MTTLCKLFQTSVLQAQTTPVASSHGTASDPTSSSLLEQRTQASLLRLQDLLACHKEALVALTSDPYHLKPTAAEDKLHHLEDLVESRSEAVRVQSVITAHLPQLDAVVESMRTALDAIYDELPSPAIHTPAIADIIAYAHRIRFTTMAGTGILMGEPAPQAAHMSFSTLWAMGDNVRKMEKDRQEQGQRMHREAAAAAQRQLQLQQQASAHPPPPSMEMPAGWKLGDPIVFDFNSLTVPDGWKPGDPIPLPTLPTNTSRAAPAGQPGAKGVTRAGAAAVAGAKTRQMFDLNEDSEGDEGSQDGDSSSASMDED
ncbi:MAG: hypothetical protein WDW38_005572 [Sanguina aurantia]